VNVSIPSFAGHLMVNTGDSWLATSDDSPVNFTGDSASMPQHADYSQMKKLRGFAYYVVQDNETIAFIKNPHYKEVPEIQIEK
jgi:oxalate decarboxylase/phosphoglucose isomerase-like protein (cupin superfamily)